MERYLITQSLLSSWSYMFECAEGYEDEAREDFIRTLKREPGETTAYMQNGIDFENEVYAEAAGEHREPHKDWEDGIRKVARIIAFAPAQVRLSRDLETSGMRFLVYGVLDALKAGTIFDVKFSNKSLGSVDVYGKYLHSAQHPAYFFLAPEAQCFQYLLSDGNDLYIETYRRGETRFIGGIIDEFIESVRGMNLLDLYKEKWIAYEGSEATNDGDLKNRGVCPRREARRAAK